MTNTPNPYRGIDSAKEAVWDLAHHVPGLREKIAGKYMIQCRNSHDFECPYLASCPHEDKEICQWQLDQADQILSLVKEARPVPELKVLMEEEFLAWAKAHGYYSWDVFGVGRQMIGAQAQRDADMKAIKEA